MSFGSMKYIGPLSLTGQHRYRCERCGYVDAVDQYRVRNETPEEAARWQQCDKCNAIEEAMPRNIDFLEWLDNVLEKRLEDQRDK